MLLQRRSLLAGLITAPAFGRDAMAEEAWPAEPVLSAAGLSAPLATPAPSVPSPIVPVLAVPPARLAAPGAMARGAPRWQRYAVAAPRTNGRPVICIVIDDLGVMSAGTARAVALPAPLTLAWFPFARNLGEQVGQATLRGHETLLHMPMQALGHTEASVGPDPLRIDLPPEENLRRLVAAIDSVPDSVGLNNHMGSVATRDVALMDLVAAETRRRDMLFLDSLTIGHSVACRQAEQAGVPACSRDVFIDDVANRDSIQHQLEQIERISRRQGHVIAIGHPRHLTLDALEVWVPGLAAKGFVLWPLSATVALRHEIAMPVELAI